LFLNIEIRLDEHETVLTESTRKALAIKLISLL